MMMRRVANSITGLVSNQIALNRCIPNAMAATHAIDSIHPPHTPVSTNGTAAEIPREFIVSFKNSRIKFYLLIHIR